MADDSEHWLSFSQAETWHDCPRGHWFEYVAGIKGDDGPDAVRGTLVHAVLEVLGRMPPERRTLREAFEVAQALGPVGAAWDAITADVGLQRAAWRHLVTALAMPEVTDVEVLATEQRFETVLDGIPFRGAIDAIVTGPRGPTPRDYKDGSGKWRAYSFDKAKKRHQLVGYAAAWAHVTGEPRPRDAEIVWTQVGAVDRYPVTDKAVEKTVGWLHEAWAGIEQARTVTEAEAVEARPGDLCSWCPAVGQCPQGLAAAAARSRRPDKSMGEPGLAALAALEVSAA